MKGLIVVGSYVELTTRQLNKVLSGFPNGPELIQQLIEKTDPSESRLLPLECRIVSKDLIKTICPRFVILPY